MTTNKHKSIMKATHPGHLDMEEALSGSEEAKQWYNDAVPYTARLYVEAAQEHPGVREALVNDDGEPQATLRKYDPDRKDEIDDLGLSAFQGLSAERVAANYLEAEAEDEDEDDTDE